MVLQSLVATLVVLSFGGNLTLFRSQTGLVYPTTYPCMSAFLHRRRYGKHVRSVGGGGYWHSKITVLNYSGCRTDTGLARIKQRFDW